MRKTVWTFGLLAGAILSTWMLATLPFLDRIGFDWGMVLGYTSMVLAFLMVYAGVRKYRDAVGGGRVTFGRALAVGLLITAVATACYVATWEVIYYKFAPDFADKYAAHVLEKARRSGATDAALAAQARELAEFKAAYQNPLVNVAYTALEPLPVGLLMSLGTAWALSRRRRPAGAPHAAAQPTLG